MAQQILHQERVAWDFARVLVSMADAAGDEQFRWFGGHLSRLLGPAVREEFFATRDRLWHSVRDDARAIEVGRWRVRVEDVLRAEPDLGEGLNLLRMDAAVRLR